MEQEKVEVTHKYLKTAVSTPYAPEGQTVKTNMVTNLLPENYKITLNRVYETKDPVVLEWYYKLAHKGEFGKRVAHLIALDAYGKIPHTSNIDELTTEEKIDQLVGTVTSITSMLVRTQKMTENTMTTQAKSINFLRDVAMNVKTQGAVLEAIETVLVNDKSYSSEDIKTVLGGIKQAFKEQE